MNIVRLRAALLLVCAACADDDPPGGTLDGVRAAPGRKREITTELCVVQARCSRDGTRWDDDERRCSSLVADWFEIDEDAAPASAACIDARLDFMACLAEQPCATLRGPDDGLTVFLEYHRRCAAFAETRDSLCRAQVP